MPHIDGKHTAADVLLMQVIVHECEDRTVSDQAFGIGDMIGFNESDDEGGVMNLSLQTCTRLLADQAVAMVAFDGDER